MNLILIQSQSNNGGTRLFQDSPRGLQLLRIVDSWQNLLVQATASITINLLLPILHLVQVFQPGIKEALKQTIVLSTSSPERKETIDERGKLLKKKEKNSSLTPEMREKIELKKRQAQEIKAQRIQAALEAEGIQNEKKVVAGERCLREFGITWRDLTVELDHLMRSRWLLMKKILSVLRINKTNIQCLNLFDGKENGMRDPSSSMALLFLCGGGWLKFPSEWGNMGDEINLEEGGRSLSSRAKDQREQELELGDLGMEEGLIGRDW
ncbi:hypothetical protein BY996DRAFT_6493125 [Phakopsora pachyrhizi]|nr:hypothetical protein BY996DRAFT_6493125 [Phakopsora pachyrhizi]